MEEMSFDVFIESYLNEIDSEPTGYIDNDIKFESPTIPAKYRKAIIQSAAYQIKKSVSEFIGEDDPDVTFYDYFVKFLSDFSVGDRLTCDIKYQLQNISQLSAYTKKSVRSFLSKCYDNDFPFEAKTRELLMNCFFSMTGGSQEMVKWQPLIQQQVHDWAPKDEDGSLTKCGFRRRRICTLPNVDHTTSADEYDVICSMQLAKQKYEIEHEDMIKDLLSKGKHIYITEKGSLRHRNFPEIIHKSLPETTDGKVTRHTKIEGWTYLQHFQTAILDNFIPPEIVRAKANLGTKALGETGDERDFIPSNISRTGSTLPFGSVTGGYSDFQDPETFAEPSFEGKKNAEKLFSLVKNELTMMEIVVWQLKFYGLDMDSKEPHPYSWKSLVDFFSTDTPENRKLLETLLLEEGFPVGEVKSYLQEAFRVEITRHELEKNIWPQIKKRVREICRDSVREKFQSGTSWK